MQEVPKPDSSYGALESAFQALPPLDSQEYLAHIDTSAPADLPPEVLVRALRQLPVHSPNWEATLERLFRQRQIDCDGETQTRWDYLGPLVAHARRHAKRAKRDSYDDLLQDALHRILTVLPTPRGAFAERAWHSFCRRELSDAWRERYGRRGERFPQEEAVGVPSTENESDPLAGIAETPPWHAMIGSNDVQRIEQVARQVVGTIEDAFVRSVAQAAWFNSERPRITGAWDKGVTLSARFPGKSRYQLMRALRHADSQLAAALLIAPDIEWTGELQRLLETLAPDPSARGRRTKQGRK